MRQSIARLVLAFAALTLAVAATGEVAVAQTPTKVEEKEAKAGEKAAKPTKSRRPRGDRNRLTLVEIEEVGEGVMTARDAIRILRPQWLNPPMGRIASSNMAGDTRAVSAIIVYVDDVRQPDLEVALVMVPKVKIVEMRYLDQNRAVQMRGPGHEAGVIEVTTTDKRK